VRVPLHPPYTEHQQGNAHFDTREFFLFPMPVCTIVTLLSPSAATPQHIHSLSHMCSQPGPTKQALLPAPSKKSHNLLLSSYGKPQARPMYKSQGRPHTLDTAGLRQYQATLCNAPCSMPNPTPHVFPCARTQLHIRRRSRVLVKQGHSSPCSSQQPRNRQRGGAMAGQKRQ
jgi:hypothetical protein